MRTFSPDEVEAIVIVRGAYESGAALRVRRDVGLTQSELAGLAGCHPTTVARLESGHRRPRPAVALRLADAWGRVLGTLADLA